MAFTVSEFHDLVELLEQQPSWRAELRRLVLTDEILRLPAVVEELAAAQKRTEQRVEELAEAQRELAEAQKRTIEQVTRLQNVIGVTLEEEAAAVLRVVLEEKGYRVLAEALYLRPDGDVDVAHQVEDAQGRRMWAVLEAKARLGWQAVEAWVNRMRSAGFRAALRREGVEGPYLVYVYGMRADASARKAVEKFGVGLLSSQGEIVPPSGVIEA